MIRGAFEFQGRSARPPPAPTFRAACGGASATTSSPKWTRWTQGPTTDFSNFISAVIDRKSFRQKLSGVLDRARADDTVDVVAGGTCDDSVGYFHTTDQVLLGTDPTREFFVHEYFGPLLSVHVYDDADYDAVLTQLEGVSPYALTGSIIARDQEVIAAATEDLGSPPGQLLHQRQAHRCRRRSAAVRWRSSLGYQRQGGRTSEPAAMDVHTVYQGDLRRRRTPLPFMD